MVHDDSSHHTSLPGFGGFGSPIDLEEPLRQLSIRLLPLQYLALSPQLLPLPPSEIIPTPVMVPIPTPPVAAVKGGKTGTASTARSQSNSQTNSQSNSQSNPQSNPTSTATSVLPLDTPPVVIEDYTTPLCSFKIPTVEPSKAKVLVEACLTASALNQHLAHPQSNTQSNLQSNSQSNLTPRISPRRLQLLQLKQLGYQVRTPIILPPFPSQISLNIP